MNVQQLKDYIHNLQVSGFDTISLQVQFYRKFSVPLFALIMAVISIPFAFLAGNRGAMAGVGISLGIAIAYEALSHVSEQLGDVALLPTVAAAGLRTRYSSWRGSTFSRACAREPRAAHVTLNSSTGR